MLYTLRNIATYNNIRGDGYEKKYKKTVYKYNGNGGTCFVHMPAGGCIGYISGS